MADQLPIWKCKAWQGQVNASGDGGVVAARTSLSGNNALTERLVSVFKWQTCDLYAPWARASFKGDMSRTATRVACSTCSSRAHFTDVHHKRSLAVADWPLFAAGFVANDDHHHWRREQVDANQSKINKGPRQQINLSLNRQSVATFVPHLCFSQSDE